jgi:phospho-N-acetylmuramoyl-pentapeptide-transferase
MIIANVIKIFLPTTLAFLIGIALTPRLTTYMYAHKLWRKKKRVEDAEITNDDFKKIQNTDAEISTPRVGGIIIWLSTLLCIGLIWLVSKVVPSELTAKLDFYSRSQTLVPLAALVVGALIGLVDDMAQIKGVVERISHRYIKILIVIAIGTLVGAWFYTKLGVNAVSVPFVQSPLYLGMLFVPFFVVILLAVFSSSVIDGMDGLAGGVFAVIFAAYSIIAFGQNQIDIAALSGVLSGSILAFLWFNIPPARFYMGETGIRPGDMVIVERKATYKPGQIVIANIDNEYTMKYLRKKGDAFYLEPANPAYKPIYPSEGFRVEAVVTGVVRKY